MVQPSKVFDSGVPDVKIDMDNGLFNGPSSDMTTTNGFADELPSVHHPSTDVGNNSPACWHIPRPSLVMIGRSDKSGSDTSNNNTWKHPSSNSSSRGSTASQGSNASTHSAASGTLLLTAANLATLAALHPPRVTAPKQLDEASVASSTHFTMVNGLGRPSSNCRKSWCARNQLTVLVCTMSFLFMIGLLAGVLYMDMRVKDKKYN